ncbi:GSCFA domain-containing protein [Paracoccus sp. R86501]|uniref:GSCFA domain-containing protein n=1 Tax=Paracoccus sp. R86501 TaxID=3101711 RepID=UPI00366D5E21
MIDGIWTDKLDIDPQDAVLTAGSCFAQHISAALDRAGFNWLKSERRPFGLDDETARAFGYDIFSFRTGNIYTTQMLKQWLQWALEGAVPNDEIWHTDGTIIDPVRPAIQPDGFDDKGEFDDSRQATLNAIRNGVEEASVFVFTLGLTEMWFNKETGLCYASCPGTLGGDFDPDVHGFHDLDHITDPDDTVHANELWGSKVLDRIAEHIGSEKLSMVQPD